MGDATPAIYQEILRTVRYENNDTLPGNPTPGNKYAHVH